MREIVLSPSFVQHVQQIQGLNPIIRSEEILNTVRTFAGALDMMPCDMAEDVIYHSLVTYSLAGRQLNQEDLIMSLNELWRIRAEKGDGFAESPTANWKHLRRVEAYKTLKKSLDPIEMGMVLHTLSDYLKNNLYITEAIYKMQRFKQKVKELMGTREAERIQKLFYCELIRICNRFVDREDYLLGCVDGYEPGEFELAFANLFIKMAKDSLKPKKPNSNIVLYP